MILRDAEFGDLTAIAEILNTEIRSGTASWTETPKTPDDMTRWFNERMACGHPVLVAEDGGEVLGYASYGPFRTGEGYRETVEHSVYVARAARGRGIARLLMERLVIHARVSGLARMVGGVSADQPASMGLHRKLGFAEQGRLKGVGIKRGKRLDLVLMVLALDAGED
ncbi:MAG TPA: GNAT family N-acetyltransferase [Thermohalobaculum sp.]|nr:GNAT family N-acetyltransferase [Thermohalobaculum sp.]